MANAKKAAVKKVEVKKVAANANTYTLSAEGKKIDFKTLKSATHRGAVLLAVKKLGSATFAAILAEVQRQKKIKTDMDLDKAVRWMCFDLVRRKQLLAK